MGSLTPDSIRSTNPNDNNEKKRCRAFLMKPLSTPSSLHLHQQSPGCRGLPQSLQSWTSCSTKVSTCLIKTRRDFTENFTTHPEFRLRETTIRGTRCRGILKREHPMYLTCRDKATWFPVATAVIPSMCMSPR